MTQKKIFETARKKGFWPELDGLDMTDEEDRLEAISRVNVPKVLMGAVSELGEAYEADRKTIPEQDPNCPAFSNLAIETAQCVARLASFAEAAGFSLGAAIFAAIEYGEKRPYRHGKRY